MNTDFATALLDPSRPPPAALKAWNGSDPSRRLAIYRNNVISSLVTALADNCPVVQALVGEDFFRAMAADFVRRAPPRSPILAHYGADFPDFVDTFEPARSVPYLADVARLETARMRALHAADVPSRTAADARHVLANPDRVTELQLQWHPSVGLLRSAYAVVSIWAAHQGAGELGEVDTQHAEDALVHRDGLDVLVLPLAPGAADLIAASQSGASLGDAATAALQTDATFDLGTLLARLLHHGALTDLVLPRSFPP